MKTKPIDQFELFCDYMGPNGCSTLYLVNKGTDQVIDCLDDALFGAQSELGANHGVYAETCGGYAGQIHGAAYLNYDGDSVMYCSNLDEYICDCEECESKGYEESTCEQKDWSAIDNLDSVHGDYKLYWVEFYSLSHLAACSPVEPNGFERVVNFLKQYINESDLMKSFEPTDMQKFHMLSSVINK